MLSSAQSMGGKFNRKENGNSLSLSGITGNAAVAGCTAQLRLLMPGARQPGRIYLAEDGAMACVPQRTTVKRERELEVQPEACLVWCDYLSLGVEKLCSF